MVARADDFGRLSFLDVQVKLSCRTVGLPIVRTSALLAPGHEQSHRLPLPNRVLIDALSKAVSECMDFEGPRIIFRDSDPSAF